MISWFRRAKPLPHGMADLHNHILPGIDDGSLDREDTIRMLRFYEEIGVSTVVSTSHLRHPLFPEITTKVIYDGVEKVRAWIEEEGLKIELHAGAEIYYDANLMDLLENGGLVPLASGPYMLIEFSTKDHMTYMKDLAFRLTMKGIRPVLAHPERYAVLQEKPTLGVEWKRAGWLFQLDLPSLLPSSSRSERKTALWLLKQNLFDIAATDMHSPPEDLAGMKKPYELLMKYAGVEEAARLLVTNPHRMVAGKDIVEIEYTG